MPNCARFSKQFFRIGNSWHCTSLHNKHLHLSKNLRIWLFSSSRTRFFLVSSLIWSIACLKMLFFVAYKQNQIIRSHRENFHNAKKKCTNVKQKIYLDWLLYLTYFNSRMKHTQRDADKITFRPPTKQCFKGNFKASNFTRQRLIHND